MSDTKEFKLAKLLEYFTGKNRIDVTDKNYESAIKLDKMIEIYNSNDGKYDKYYKMKSLFTKSSAFYDKYSYLEEFSNKRKVKYLFRYVEQITLFFAEIENNLSKESEKTIFNLKKNHCIEDYPYAAYYVSEYISFNDSTSKKDFLLSKGLVEIDFDRFVRILVDVDSKLYDKYLEKDSRNRLNRQLDTIRKLENIRSGVTTGYTNEGYEFDEVEYYCNYPFYDQETSRTIMDDFNLKVMSTLDQRFRVLLENLCFADANKIMKYAFDNKLVGRNPSKIKEEEIMNTRYIINGEELSRAAKEEIISYMKRRKIPFFTSSFTAVKNKYLNKGLEKEEQLVLKK